jgi:hypothetical protein
MTAAARYTSVMNQRLFIALFAILLGCGGSEDTGGSIDGGTDGAPTDTSTSDVGGSDTRADIGADVGGSTACGDKTCSAGEVCTKTYTTGGACQFCGDDAGACPAGRHCSGACCVDDVPTYFFECKPSPTECASGLTCSGACGGKVCSGGCPCESAAGNTMTCHCLAP